MSTNTNPANNGYFDIYTNSVLCYAQSIRKIAKSQNYTLTLSVPTGQKQLPADEERQYVRFDLTVYPDKESGKAILDFKNAHPDAFEFKNKDKASIYLKASDIMPAIYKGEKDGKPYEILAIKGRVLDVSAIYYQDECCYKKSSEKAEKSEPVSQPVQEAAA